MAKRGCTNKACGRTYGKADLASNRRNQHKRVQSNRANHKAGTYGNGDGKDMSHTNRGTLVKEKASTNRSRNGKDGKSTKKKVAKPRRNRRKRRKKK